MVRTNFRTSLADEPEISINLRCRGNVVHRIHQAQGVTVDAAHLVAHIGGHFLATMLFAHRCDCIRVITGRHQLRSKFFHPAG